MFFKRLASCLILLLCCDSVLAVTVRGGNVLSKQNVNARAAVARTAPRTTNSNKRLRVLQRIRQ